MLVPVLSAWGLGLGAHQSSATAMLAGIGGRLLTVAVVHRLDLARTEGAEQQDR